MDRVPKLTICGKTDTGLQRDHNEDTVAWDETYDVIVLADGMGGHNAGEVASELAVENALAYIRGYPDQVGMSPETDCTAVARDAVFKANEAIFAQAGEDILKRGMGTTIVMAMFCGNQIVYAHVGDSRLYRLRGAQLEQLTKDHSLLQELIDSGVLTPEEAATSSNKNIITRALGLGAEVEVDVGSQPLCAGDCFLFCSDGLSDLVDDAAIGELLAAQDDDLEMAVTALIERANQNGGTDNISVILIRVDTLV